MEPILFRVDAGPQIGTGHVMRCLALEQHLRDAGTDSVFATCMSTPAIEECLRSEGVKSIQLPVNAGSINDAKQTINLAKELSSSWIVADGYHFDTNYQYLIKNSGLHLLLIDDLGSSDHFYADILLNQNIYASENLYLNRDPDICLLLGTRYVLLRKEFLKWQQWKREIPETAQNLLITLGGSDPENTTQKVIDAIQQTKLKNLNVILVAANNKHYGELKSIVLTSKGKIQLKRNVTQMSDLMAWADMAVSAGGTTSWELAFMGLPTLSVVLADNQYRVVKELDKVGVTISLGWHRSLTSKRTGLAIETLGSDPKTRATMSKNARNLVDGYGAQRVLAEF